MIKIQNSNQQPASNNLHPNIGFTIIEILVALTIIFIFISFGFAGYASFNQKQTLISGGQTLKSIIRDAQSRAYNNEIDCTPGVCNCGAGSNGNLTGWYVDFDRKSIYGECGSNRFGEKPFSMSADVTIIPVPTNLGNLLYRSLPPSVSQSAVICLSTSGLLYSITINNAGVVTDSGGLVSSCP